jgi:ornithine cyclodeaminase/alanine dehydrogenase-like protein (mu-crystallin family)
VKQRLGRELLYLSRAEVASVGLTMLETISALESMFIEKAKKRVEMPPKVGIHPMPNAFLHAMPALIPISKAAGMKWVGGYPDNSKRGLPYISGLFILNDSETGFPLAVMDCTWITEQRTGAATAIAAKHLARPDSSVVGVLGCGAQGRSNFAALKAVLPVKEVRAYDLDHAQAARYAEEMGSVHGVDARAVATPQQAVKGCDIVVTAGPILRTPHATIQHGWLSEGAFASLVDFDAYWHPDALREADKFCTDDVPQLEHYRGLGYFQDIPNVYADLGELVAGQRPGRQDPHERTIACNLGLALEDVATATLVYARALEKDLGIWLQL